ncbi:MAG: D-arabinono-1,4-lactone oxidase, partial [Bryobacteraceae bacterium]
RAERRNSDPAQGEFGQVGSYITNIKLVLPSGELLEVTEDQPELLAQVRSSYGTFGIVYEATYRVRPIVPMAVHHETYSLSEFIAKLPELKESGESLMYYIFFFEDLITVEMRHYNPEATGSPNRTAWPLRNYMWANAGPLFCAQVEANIPIPEIRYSVIDGFCAMWRFKLETLVKSDNTIATDQIIKYPPVSDGSRYTFSLWAFPEEQYPTVLPAYAQFVKKYYADTGYRTNMLHVGYRILKDQESLLSYSYDGNVMTIDPVSTANPGWKPFLLAYNQFCFEQGGLPLLNQTPQLTQAQIAQPLGDRWTKFAEVRQSFDPSGRLLNPYFRTLLGLES